MLQKLSKRKDGFTIIEVLIVLAIAGLILLVVFLAVPALQRNSRNTQIKNATASVLGAVTEFQNNNNGQVPTGIATTTAGVVTVSGGTGTTSNTVTIQSGFTATGAENATALTSSSDTGTIVVKFNAKCNGNVFSTTKTSRAMAAMYLIESGSSNVPQCTES